MSDNVQINIIAKDNASKVFGQVGAAGKKMGSDLKSSNDQLRASNDKLAQSLEKEAQAAEKAATAHGNLKKNVQDIGVAMGVLGAAVALSGQAFRDNEIAVSTLGRTYGAAGEQLIAFAEQIQDTTNFSNDAAIAAANSFGTLARNYGLTVDQIQNLISVSADLAAVSGMSLESAAQRVQAAIRGEAESAEALGLTLNQMAIDHDNVTFGMSNAEAAAFRLNAVLTQSTFATGAAAEQADTAYGSFVDLKDGMQDFAQSVGGALGPIGELGAFFADNAVQAVLFTAGLAKVVQGVAAARTAILTLAATHTSVALLVSSLGPAAGLAAAAGIAMLAMDQLESNVESGTLALERMDVAAGDLDEVVRQLFATGNQLAFLGEQGAAFFPGIEEDITNMSNLESQIATLNAQGGPQNQQQIDKLAEWEAQLAALMVTYGGFNSTQLESTENAILFADAEEALTGILANVGEGAALQQEALAGLVRGHQLFIDTGGEAGISAIEFATALVVLGGAAAGYDEEATAAAAATGELGGAAAKTTKELFALADALSLSLTAANNVSPGLNSILEVMGLLDDKGPGGGGRAGALASDLHGLAATLGGELTPNILTSSNALNELLGLVAAPIQGGGREGIQAVASDLHGMGAAMADTLTTAEDLAAAGKELETAFASAGEEFTGTTTHLDNMFRVIVGNTNAIAQQSQAVADWATELIGAEGTVAAIDDLLANGSITLQQYTDAQRAHNTILADNAMIQNDILSIQAQLAPVIAEATAAQARYINEIATGSTEAQMLALAYMDSATAAEALGLAQAYISDQDTFGPMLESAANLDPFLAAILSDMGLIEQQPDKTWKVVAQAEMSEVELLTSAIDALTDAIVSVTVEVDDSALDNIGAAQGFPMGGGEGASGGRGMNFVVTMTADNSDVTAKIDDSTSKLNTWASSSGTGKVLANNADATSKMATAQSALARWGGSSGTGRALANNSQALSAIGSVSSALAALNGRTATTYVTTVYQTVGTPQGMGGVTKGYANGGVVAELAEWGPELVHTPSGGMGLAVNRGMYNLPVGSYVDTAPSTTAKLSSFGGVTLNMTINGNVGIDNIAEEVTRKIVPAIQSAASQHLRSYGL